MDFDSLSKFQLKIKNFKCFGEEPQGFSQLKPVNIIIGRNNTGKSSLIDLIRYTSEIPATSQSINNRSNSPNIPKELWNTNNPSELFFSYPLNTTLLKQVFSKGTSGGYIGGDHWQFGQNLMGLNLTWSWSLNRLSFVDIGVNPTSEKLKSFPNAQEYLNNLVSRTINPLGQKKFYQINPDRDIKPELDQDRTNSITANGDGITNLIQHCLNKADLNKRELVEITLLEELNKIFTLDTQFDRILCQQLENKKWEIYLDESKKGRIPLSQSGHGLKTIIIVLCHTILIPEVFELNLQNCIFAFEELENNLHPALLRKLLAYLYEVTLREKCLLFITTHSNVVIDLFSRKSDTQILHVIHDGKQSFVKNTDTYFGNKSLLDDLGVRASDLLQTNSLIWVEGPSDSIYINKWIELWSNGELSEGVHYQCIFYGGGLRKHLSAEDPEIVISEVAIFGINRNAIIISDSDKNNRSQPIDAVKQKIHHEIEKNHGLSWITKGRDIENYLPKEIVSQWLKDDVEDNVGQYEDFFEYLNNICSLSRVEKSRKRNNKKYKKEFSRCKQKFALQVIPFMTQENIKDVYDLNEKMTIICQKIKKWNQMN